MFPENGRALIGMAEASRALGDDRAEQQYRQRASAAWSHADTGNALVTACPQLFSNVTVDSEQHASQTQGPVLD